MMRAFASNESGHFGQVQRLPRRENRKDDNPCDHGDCSNRQSNFLEACWCWSRSCSELDG